MKISFDLQLADLVAFVRYHDSHSPRVRWTRAIAAVVVLAPFVILPLVLLPTEYRPAALAAVAVGTFVSAFRMPAAFDRGVERNVRKLYSGPKGANTFGMHELELTDTSLIKRTDYIESTTRFAALGPVICEELHLCLRWADDGVRDPAAHRAFGRFRSIHHGHRRARGRGEPDGGALASFSEFH
jgi:hypothetical protein